MSRVLIYGQQSARPLLRQIGAEMRQLTRSAAEPAAWIVLVPLAFASLLTGFVQSLGTTWGLVRHYWVLFKLLINVFATIVLLMYTQTLGYLADLARQATLSSDDLGLLQTPSVVIHAALALLVLLVATVLAVYKPRGMTLYGRRKQLERPAAQR
jgi:hypothetical protein